jgi:septum site-determining protein MinC
MPTKVIDKPVRSGQRIYAEGSDLVVLGSVNPGGELIADGSIHIYGALRGKALAGARGEAGARIYCTDFDAELVSIAGVYRVFEPGTAGTLSGRAVQVKLQTGSRGDQVMIEAL